MKTKTHLWRNCVIVAAGVWLAACGGSRKGGPEPAVGPEATPAAQAQVSNKQGVQVGIRDVPSSGAGTVAERPVMSAAAREPYLQALDAFGRGDLAEAKRLFQDAISKDSKAYQAHYSVGVVMERLRESDALGEYRQAFAIVPDYEPAITAYGLLLARSGNMGEADQFLTERRAKMPKSAAVAAALAEVKSMQGDTGSSQQLAQDALKANPNYPPAMVTLARDHYRNRRLDLARYALEAILDGFGVENPPRDKNNADARLLRALILREEGRRNAAIAELERVISVRPDLVDASTQLASYYLEAGNADRALPLLERALRYDKDHLVAHLNLGDAYRLTGRPEQAKREFDWVLAKDSTQIGVHYNVGLLYLFSESYPGMTPVQQADAAIRALEKYKELRGRSVAPEGSDVETLIVRAKAKKAMLEANASADKPASAPATAPASSPASAPAGKGATKK